MRLKTWISLLAFLPLLMLASGISGAATSNGTTGGNPSGQMVITGPDQVSAPPANGASLSQWQSWAAAQSQAMRTADWAQAAESIGCQLESVSFVTVDSSIDPGVSTPPGVTTTGVGLLMKCSSSSTSNSSSMNASISPDSVPLNGACGTVGGPGSQCVAPASYNGNPNYVNDSYLYKGSGSIKGHLELSDDGPNAQSCSVGGLIENYPPGTYTTLTNDTEVFFLYGPKNISTVWNGNFWKGTGNPYANEGNVCSLF